MVREDMTYWSAAWNERLVLRRLGSDTKRFEPRVYVPLS